MDEEARLGSKIEAILRLNGKNTPSGPFSTLIVGLYLAMIQRRCKHTDGYEEFTDPDGKVHSMCKNCLKEKD